MKPWRATTGLLFLAMVHFALAATDDAAGLCETTDSGGICKSSAVETLFVDGAKLQAQIDELATFSDTPAPSVTRILYTPNDVAARGLVALPYLRRCRNHSIRLFPKFPSCTKLIANLAYMRFKRDSSNSSHMHPPTSTTIS